ncbi:MAG: 1-acyl-sn-glycerol-3-phosphate acyltransferase [Candidatus Omnitrophica bacterium]|nr:1-acyl-sn-glycerol-3-phosphate acyltransferase [Candidatus Omnitrophota bacterium]
MIAFLRRIYRITALLVWSTFLALVSIPWQLQGGWRRVSRISRFVHYWNKGVARIVNLRVSVHGSIPDAQGGLVVSNHLSYIDIVAHGSVLPLRYSPKSEIAHWPLLGWFLGLSQPIWTNRESKQASRKALRDFAKTVKRGMYLIVYPEGTTTDGTRGILPFKSTSFEAAITGKTQILPVITRYKEVPGRQTVCWHGEMTLLPHIWNVLAFSAIEVDLYFLKPVLPNGMSRKELAAHVRSLMLSEYKKIYTS